MKKIILASSNNGKIKEIQQFFSNYEIIPQQDFSIKDADETALSFVENSIIKARNASKIGEMPAIADDSGILVKALNGEPGIFSARYSGKNNNEKNIDKLLKNMKNKKNRQAYFYCAMVYVKNAKDPAPIIVEGIWNGEILQQKVGENGFGYDSVFFVPTHNCSAAELSNAEKNLISHRGQALKSLQNRLIF